MALHTDTEIYKATYALCQLVTQLVAGMPRNYKADFGADLRKGCMTLVRRTYQANVREDKAPVLQRMREEVEEVNLALRLLVRDGVPLNPEAMAAIDAQHAIYETVTQRFARTDRAAFTPQELLVARTAAAVFDDLVELDRNGLAKEAALWSMAQMQAIGRHMKRNKA